MSVLFSDLIDIKDFEDFKILSFYNIIEKSDLVTLIPSGHAAYYPLKLISLQKKLKNELNFFNRYLYDNYDKSNNISESEYTLTSNQKINV